MSTLQRVVYLSQSDYNKLARGETVTHNGISMSSLNDNYIYMTDTGITNNDISEPISIANGGTGLSQTNPHKVFIGPSSGNSTYLGDPSWRLLTVDDLPTITNAKLTNDSLTVGNKTIALGGTGTLNEIIMSPTTLNGASWDITDVGSYRTGGSSMTGELHPGTPTDESTPYSYGLLIVTRAGTYGAAQIYISHYSSSSTNAANGIRYRSGWDVTNTSKTPAQRWEGWATILDSHNYSLFVPTFAGAGATGTWEISISGDAGGNAATATKFKDNASNTTKVFYRGDNAWSNILKLTASAALGIDSSKKIGTAIKDLHFSLTSGSGTGINNGNAGGITFGTDSAAYGGIYWQTSSGYGSRLHFATTSNFSNGAYTRMIILPGGNVGIGTLNPTSALEVNGTVTATNFSGTWIGNSIDIAHGGTGAGSVDAHTILMGPNPTNESDPDLAAPTWRLIENADLPGEGTITIGNVDVSLGESITLSDLGLSTALHYKGTVNAAPTSGSGYAQGDVVINTTTHKEYVFDGTNWQELGDESSYKLKLTAVSDPTVPVSGTNTAISFIDSITQNANGEITPTKKTVRTGTTSVAGILKLGTTSADASAGNHGHGNISNDGTFGSTEGIAITTNDRLVIVDHTTSKIIPTSIVFDTTTSNASNFLGQDGTWKVPDKVLQDTVASNSLESEFPVLISHYARNAQSTSDPAITHFNSNIYVLPSSGTLTATKFAGDLEGDVTGDLHGYPDHVLWSAIDDPPSTYTPSSHSHGGIDNDGKSTTNGNTIINNNDAIMIAQYTQDNSTNLLIVKSCITFDGITTNTALTPKGTWESFNLVKQGSLSSSGNYPILFSAEQSPTSDNDYETVFDSSIYGYLSNGNGVLHAHTFEGNASTATAWAAALKVQVDLETIYGTGSGESETTINADESSALIIGITGTLGIDHGGTGIATAPTLGGIIYAASTIAYGCTSDGTLGQLLMSNGTNAPTWYGGLTVTDGSTTGALVMNFLGTTASTSTVTGAVTIAGGLGVDARVTAREFDATKPMKIINGLVYSDINSNNSTTALQVTTGMLFSNGVAFAHPSLTTNGDHGWIRILGTNENNTELEIAVGDNGGAGESITVKLYDNSNTETHILTLLDNNGKTSIPVTVMIAGTPTASTPAASATLYNNGASYLNGNTSINGSLTFTSGTSNTILWNGGTYQQRISITDDSSANNALFTFEQSTNSGSSFDAVCTIKDNGQVAATSYLIDSHVTLQWNDTDSSLDFVFA